MTRLAQLKPPKPLAGPLRLTVRWCFPTSGRRRSGEPMTCAPDLDNMAKVFADCLTRTGIIEDDRLIVEERLGKAWWDPAGVFFEVEQI
jgi:Holliday junction resolvase RusA-like endonuclease